MLEKLAAERLAKVKVRARQARRGGSASSLAELLEQQRKRIAKADAEFDPKQLRLPGIGEDERREREADRRHWQSRLVRLEKEIREEPAAHPRLLRGRARTGWSRSASSISGRRTA